MTSNTLASRGACPRGDFLGDKPRGSPIVPLEAEQKPPENPFRASASAAGVGSGRRAVSGTRFAHGRPSPGRRRPCACWLFLRDNGFRPRRESATPAPDAAGAKRGDEGVVD